MLRICIAWRLDWFSCIVLLGYWPVSDDFRYVGREDHLMVCWTQRNEKVHVLILIHDPSSNHLNPPNPQFYGILWNKKMMYSGLLIGHGEKFKFCRIFRDKFAEKRLISWKIHRHFRANFAEKQLIKNGWFRRNFRNKFCWKVIGYALIWWTLILPSFSENDER